MTSKVERRILREIGVVGAKHANWALRRDVEHAEHARATGDPATPDFVLSSGALVAAAFAVCNAINPADKVGAIQNEGYRRAAGFLVCRHPMASENLLTRIGQQELRMKNFASIAPDLAVHPRATRMLLAAVSDYYVDFPPMYPDSRFDDGLSGVASMLNHPASTELLARLWLGLVLDGVRGVNDGQYLAAGLPAVSDPGWRWAGLLTDEDRSALLVHAAVS